MNKLYIFCILLLSSSLLTADEEIIKSKLKNVLPADTVIESIEPSPFKGVYKVYYGDLQPIYVSKDGNFFIFGDMYRINGQRIENITDQEKRDVRVQIINKMPEEEFISFKANNELHVVTIFTDVDCGYCRKLHNQISEYNDLGISVRYAAFPRSGIGTEAFSKMVGAWCSNNPKKSLTSLKNNKKIDLSICDNQPVSKHYVIGQRIGVTGTPAIFTASGEIIPGYLSPEDLIQKLKS
jgi:thiol:disulfide interchange protein DsbC